MIGNTLYVKNSSVPMLEITLEMDSETEFIQNNDILYLLPESEVALPTKHHLLDPKKKYFLSKSSFYLEWPSKGANLR